MRIISFKDLNLAENLSEGEFYNEYLKEISNIKKIDFSEDELPQMKYEIVKLDLFGGKVLLLDKNLIKFKDLSGQELYFDYDIAYKIYEKYIELNVLEKEKVENNNDESKIFSLIKEIDELKNKDLKKFNQKSYDYTFLINTKIYSEYKKLKDENRLLKEEIKNIKENNELVKENNDNNRLLKRIKKIFKIGE